LFERRSSKADERREKTFKKKIYIRQRRGGEMCARVKKRIVWKAFSQGRRFTPKKQKKVPPHEIQQHLKLPQQNIKKQGL
jgi:hypothetical protein